MSNGTGESTSAALAAAEAYLDFLSHDQQGDDGPVDPAASRLCCSAAVCGIVGE